MNQKIIDYFKQNKIDIEILQVIESLQYKPSDSFL